MTLEKDGKEVYDRILKVQYILDDLTARQQYGLSVIRSSEYEKYAKGIAVYLACDEKNAYMLISGCIAALDMGVAPDFGKSYSNQKNNGIDKNNGKGNR